MKLPFSYKDQSLFTPLLTLSIAVHIAGFAVSGAGLFSSQPHFSVDQGLGSIEVIIDKTPEEKEIEKPEDKVMTAKTPAAEAPEVNIPEPKKVEPPKEIPQKPVYIPEVKGAMTEEKIDYLKNPAPRYPRIARDKGWEGTVLLEALVDKKGYPEEVTVLRTSGYSVLDDAALSAVKKWRFKPAHAGAFSFSSRAKIPVRFVLEKK